MSYQERNLPRSDPRHPDFDAWRAECARAVAAQRAIAAYGKEAGRHLAALAERYNLSDEELARRLHEQERARYAYSHEAQQRYLAAMQAQAEAEEKLRAAAGLPPHDGYGAKQAPWMFDRKGAEQRAAELDAREHAREVAGYETKAAPLARVPALEVKMVGTEARFTGLASTFGPPPDLGDDIVDAGAFRATIQAARENANPTTPSRRRVLWPLLWNHDRSNPIGAIVDAHETSRGLEVEGLIATDVSDGQRAYSLLSKGYVAGLSIGYRAVNRRYQGNTRHLVTISLFEVSVVPFPANPRAGVTSISH